MTDLDGDHVDLLSSPSPTARVLVFMRTDCPIGNRYAPEIRRLYEEFVAQDVEFALVYPNQRESEDDIRQHLQQFNLNIPAFRDPDRILVDRVQARTTPEVAVFDSQRKMLYRGRIDDRFVEFGMARAEARHHDLQDVLQAIVDGQTVESYTTDAVGCYIE